MAQKPCQAYPKDGDISWSSKKQSYIALSTMRSVCYLLNRNSRRFIIELDIVARTLEPVTIHFHSMATLTYANDPKYHGKTKDIDIRYYFIHNMVAQKEVILKHISMNHIVDDLLTMSIARETYQAYVRRLTLCRL